MNNFEQSISPKLALQLRQILEGEASVSVKKTILKELHALSNRRVSELAHSLGVAYETAFALQYVIAWAEKEQQIVGIARYVADE